MAQKDDGITSAEDRAKNFALPLSVLEVLTPDPLRGFLFFGIHQMECPIIAEVWHVSVQGKYLRTLIKMPIASPDLEKFSLGSPRYGALELQRFGNHCSDLAFYHYICWNRKRRYFIFLSIFSLCLPSRAYKCYLKFWKYCFWKIFANLFWSTSNSKRKNKQWQNVKN